MRYDFSWRSAAWRSISRTSRLKLFYEKGAFRDFGKFTGKHLCQSLFFNKVASLRPANVAKFLRTLSLTELLRCLLLCLSKFNIRISCVFIISILPVFLFEVVSCTKNVEHEWKKLNMNDNNKKIFLKLCLKFVKMFKE